MANDRQTSITLIGEKGKTRGQRLRFDQCEVSVGRSDSCDVVLPDDTVSRYHATITFDGNGFVIEDSSTNGTFVNGSRIRGRHSLSQGDLLQIGPDNALRFERQVQDTTADPGSAAEPQARQPAPANIVGLLKSTMKEKPVLVMGLGVYLFLIILGAIWLQFSSSGSAKVSAEQANHLVSKVEKFLVGASARDKAPSTNLQAASTLLAEGKNLEPAADNDLGASYASLVKYREALRLCGYGNIYDYRRAFQGKVPDTGVSGQVAIAVELSMRRILSRAQAMTYSGWIAESQGKRDEAIRIYERLIALIPDDESPSYEFAKERIRSLKV